MKYRIGFPLGDAAPGSDWEFVVVRGTEEGASYQAWSGSDDRRRADFLSAKTGAHWARKYQPRRQIHLELEFLHLADEQEGLPSTWSEHSDSVACALALVQEDDIAEDAPIILISCASDFSKTHSFRGQIVPVGRGNQKTVDASLLAKWRGAVASSSENSRLLNAGLRYSGSW
jgi:hypothetical protein